MTTSQAVATRLEDALAPFVGGELPVRLVAWDGSTAGPADAPQVELRSPDAVRRLLWQPGELGAAQAYVTGELDVRGDLDAALSHAFAVARDESSGVGGCRCRPWHARCGRPSDWGSSAVRPLRPRPRLGSAVGCTARSATGARSATTTT